jgi:hypothetical protein
MTDGAPPGHDPKVVRTSLVDSGWSAPPPPLDEPTTEVQRLPLPTLPVLDARSLPSYAAHEAAAGSSMPDVTQVDRQIQSRAKAMREKDTLPPPRRASAFPPAPPPAPVVRAQEPPVVIQNASYVTATASASAPPAVRPPPPSVRPPPPVAPVARPYPPSIPPPAGAGEADPQSISAARSAATIVRPRSVNPPALPSFGAALAQRVRFAGGEVPLWTLITPLVLLVALGTAFAAAAVTAAADPSANAPSLKPSAEPSASVASVALALPAPLPPPAASSANTANNEDKPKPLTLLERVAQGDDAAVKELSAKPVADFDVEEAISLSLGQSAQDVRAARALRDRIDHDPGLIKDAEVLSELRRYSDDPETSRDALAAMANVPGPISADLIYEVWTATASRTTATDLARSLIYSKEVRAKASPALAVTLDLRDAETCEQNRDLLPRVTTDGDKRAFHLLSKLTRKYGCGPNKRADCYACLRDGKDLDAAMKVVKTRREPHPFGG